MFSSLRFPRRRRPAPFSLVLAALAVLAASARPVFGAGQPRLVPLPAPRITGTADPVVFGGANPAENLVDGNLRTEYASAGKGLKTFVDFDFGAPTRIAGFEHVDRENGTIAGSELTLFDAQGRVVGRYAIRHPDTANGVAFLPIWPAVVARRARWQVTKLGGGNVAVVGGAEITFFGVGPVDATPTATLGGEALPIATPGPAGMTQPLDVTIDYPYPQPADATLRVAGLPPRAVRLVPGPQTVHFTIPTADHPRVLRADLAAPDGTQLAEARLAIPAFRKLTIYILPHSHVDIGFTEIQTAIQEKQLNNLLVGMAAAQRTADYPAGARFVWNLEGLWPADLLERRLSAPQRHAFATAVREGHVALDGMYFNTLTGLCRPEDLIRLFQFGADLKTKLHVPLDSAMISDVPGYTWGTVTAMAAAGIKYFSAAPNIFDRIGSTYVAWENKPFWWVGPARNERVLVWVPVGGYNLAARIGAITPGWVTTFLRHLAATNYPYDIDYIRWSRGDNAPPDTAVADEIRDWNARHPWPHFVIGSVHDAFQAMAHRYGPELPSYRGDWTPYWVDGAASSARQTAMNRANSDRLTQAQALWAMQDPATYPVRDFTNAAREILLYDEHTWGASTSVTAPDRKASLDQWSVKASYAATADRRTRGLLSRALALANRGHTGLSAVDVYNTSSWPRSGVAILYRDYAVAGDRVTDAHGAPVPSQRLRSGELAIYVRDLPAYSSRRYFIGRGAAYVDHRVTLTRTTLDNGLVHVALDPRTGGIVDLRAAGLAGNFADTSSGQELNEYLYFNGYDTTKARSNGPVTISVRDRGPLIASLVVKSAAPGCHELAREVKLVAGEDYVEVSDLVDKARLVAPNYLEPSGKESVNFAFPFAVPHGQVRLEVPYGVIRPDRDQIPGACKNWFAIDRWADVSNADVGVTWVSLDSPLVEVGGLTANLLNSQTNPAVWRQHVGPTQKLYAWVMNNHWGTNYRAYQSGPVTFRFLLRPHGPYDPVAASRLAIAASRPLLAVRAHSVVPPSTSRLTVDSPGVIVTGFKPSEDGRAVIVRLWAAGGRDVLTHLRWSDPQPARVWLSDTSEQPLRPAGKAIRIPAWGLVTLRADLR